MKKQIVMMLLAASTAMGAFQASAQAQPVVPAPEKWTPGNGEFKFNGKTPVYTNLTGRNLEFMQEYMPQVLPVGKVEGEDAKFSDAPRVILYCLNPEINVEEAADNVAAQGYTLNIQPDQVMAIGMSPAATFYAVQSLRQLLRPDSTITDGVLYDSPRFPYRGVLLDASRHFWPKDMIYRQLDKMAAVKLNRFHFHLTDAGGWRMQSDRYPLLTDKTGWRTQEDWQKWWVDRDRQYCDSSATAYGGYYTKDDLRDIVKYAADRQITVIPEIEMPGHSEEVNFAYPELSCSGIPAKDGEMCIGNPKTFEFIENVLEEVMEIFPSTYIHIGGDECAHTAWEACEKCQALMKDQGMQKSVELQTYLTDSIGRFLAQHGRTLIGWDEIMDGTPHPSAAVMSWRGTAGGLRAAQKGHPVVMSPGSHCYFDQPADTLAEHRHHPSAPRGPLSLEKAYSFEPVPAELTGTPAETLILGLQGNLWTEWIPTEEVLNFLLWPRAAAIAQVGWSVNKPSFEEFQKALELHGFGSGVKK